VENCHDAEDEGCYRRDGPLGVGAVEVEAEPGAVVLVGGGHFEWVSGGRSADELVGGWWAVRGCLGGGKV
jgi:hypothetical protein